jgi:hypothetical protein
VNLGIFERMVHPRQPDLADITNFLLLQYPQALGTSIHATPLIAAIHAAIPGARVSAAASGFALDILRNNPGLERVVATPSPLRELLPAANAIRRANVFGRERFAVLLTTGNERSRVILSALLAGSPTRAGFTLVPELAAAHLTFDPRLSQIANNLLPSSTSSSPTPALSNPWSFPQQTTPPPPTNSSTSRESTSPNRSPSSSLRPAPPSASPGAKTASGP